MFRILITSHNNCKYWQITFLLLIFLAYKSAYGSKMKSSKQPHIIVIMADDLGWNDISFHGANQIPTPNIDALAYNGLILNKHYVLPTCTPSRTAFMTGRYPIKFGMQGYPLIAGEPRGIPLTTKLLPQHLKRLGYITRLVGKWHVGYFTKYHTPIKRGFDSFFGYYNGYIQYYNHSINQYDIIGNDLHRDEFGSLNAVFLKGYFTDLITEEAEQIITNHDIAKPLFLQINHLAPHSSDAKDSMEVRNKKELNETFGYIKDINRQKFASIVSTVDESVGRIVSSLKNASMLDNSIILFMSDNGAQTEGFLENFGSNYPLRGLKFTLYEGGIRGVACLYSPLIKDSQRVVNQLIHITDWLPTLYSAAGGNLDDLGDLDGVDQWPVLQNSQSKARDFLLLNIDDNTNLEGAISGRFKLIKGAKDTYGNYYGDDGRSELNPAYNVTQILESAVNKAIAGILMSTISTTKMIELRSTSEVSCGYVHNFSNCSKRCLFDIFSDPCESKDISGKYPQVVRFLEYQINKYRIDLVTQSETYMDPNSDPKYFNGTWMPWIDYTNYSSNINTSITIYVLILYLFISFY